MSKWRRETDDWAIYSMCWVTDVTLKFWRLPSFEKLLWKLLKAYNKKRNKSRIEDNSSIRLSSQNILWKEFRIRIYIAMLEHCLIITYAFKAIETSMIKKNMDILIIIMQFICPFWKWIICAVNVLCKWNRDRSVMGWSGSPRKTIRNNCISRNWIRMTEKLWSVIYLWWMIC